MKPKKANGRPRLNQDGVLVQVTAKVPTSTYEQLATAAFRTNTPLSALVRRLLDPNAPFGKQK